MSVSAAVRAASAGSVVVALIAVVVGVTAFDGVAAVLLVVAGALLLATAAIVSFALPRVRTLLRVGAEHRALTKRLARDVAELQRTSATSTDRAARRLDDIARTLDRTSQNLERHRTGTDGRLVKLSGTLRDELRRVDRDVAAIATRVADADGRAGGRAHAVERSIDALALRVSRMPGAVDAPAEAFALSDHLAANGWPAVAVETPELAAAVRSVSPAAASSTIRGLGDPGTPPELVVVDGSSEGAGVDAAVSSGAPTVATTVGPHAAAHLARLLDAGFTIDRRVGPRGELTMAGRRRRRAGDTLTGPPVNVFVLSTGRSGTATFAKACGHFTNFTAGHEVNARTVGAARLDYPPMHIEADNRLAWMLGPLAERFDDRPVLYVHLIRDRDAVLESLIRRWDSPFRANITRAVGHGIITRVQDWEPDQVVEVCNFFIDTVLANIREFTRTRPSMDLHLETLTDEFGGFVEAIGAHGDIAGAFAELGVRHNAS